jgi:UDP-N-acetylmuramyl pentapeptide synthase
MALNSVAVLAAVAALGGDPARAAPALEQVQPLAGRGRKSAIAVASGIATLIDESYNASPDAMRAAFAVLGSSQPGPGGRRIAVIGDMRELGEASPALHRALAPDIAAAGVDLVFTVGSNMRALWEVLPENRRGAHAEEAAALLPQLRSALTAGDIVTVKGSLGTRMSDIVQPLLRQPSPIQEKKSC